MAKKIIGDVDLSNLYLKRLPDILKDITVSGNFYCGFNNLTSLEGSPSSVGRHFSCIDNKLTTLKGSPSSVGGHFSCRYNNLTSLKGAPIATMEPSDDNCGKEP